jgi:hypothetical protein
MQEKEQKLLRLYESQTQRAFQRVGRGSAGSSSSSVSSTSSTLGAGKVRQLFHERRQQQNGLKTAGSGPTGWDRSYPLEPLDTTTKQRLQASKSTGNLKAVRGTSLERNYTNNITTSNHYQVRNQARRSKSQVRSNNYIVADLGGSFRQQQLYDDDDVIDYPQNLQPRHYRDVQNNRIGLERDQRESEFLHEQRIYDKYEDEDYDIEDEDPPFQQLDDDVDDLSDSSRVFQKLPNVGGRLLMETKTSSNNNVDRYKTYSATSNGTRASGSRLTPPVVKEPLQRRREPLDAAPVAKPKTTVAPKKPDVSRNVPLVQFGMKTTTPVRYHAVHCSTYTYFYITFAHVNFICHIYVHLLTSKCFDGKYRLRKANSVTTKVEPTKAYRHRTNTFLFDQICRCYVFKFTLET